MYSIYDQELIFVVFAPGFSGSFIKNILLGLIYSDYRDLELSDSGHTHKSHRPVGIPHLPGLIHLLNGENSKHMLGSESSTKDEARALLDRYKFNEIRKYVIASHATVDDLRSVFPNSTILPICYNNEQYLIGHVNNFLKVHLESIYEQTASMNSVPNAARYYFPNEDPYVVAKYFHDARSDDKLSSVLLSAYLKIVDETGMTIHRGFEEEYSVLEHDRVHPLDFSAMQFNKPELSYVPLSKALNVDLSAEQMTFINGQFSHYYNKQRKGLFVDVVRFMRQTHSIAEQRVPELRKSRPWSEIDPDSIARPEELTVDESLRLQFERIKNEIFKM